MTSNVDHIEMRAREPQRIERNGMELTNVAVQDRIADLNRLASELRLERASRTRAARGGAMAPHAVSLAPRPTQMIGAWLIGLGTALGGNVADAGRADGR